MKPAVVWNAGPPPRRGVYRTCSDGPSKNIGWRYWFGDRWGSLYRLHKDAAEADECRRPTLKYPVLWASKSAPPADRSEQMIEALKLAREHIDPTLTGDLYRTVLRTIDEALGEVPDALP